MSRAINRVGVSLQKGIAQESTEPVPPDVMASPDHGWLRLWFGRHRGKTLPEILLAERTYVTEFLSFSWPPKLRLPVHDREVRLLHQLEVLCSRAENILVPTPVRNTHFFAFWKTPDRAFGGFSLVRKGKKPKPPTTGLILHDVGAKLVFSLPRAFRYPGKGDFRMAEAFEACLLDCESGSQNDITAFFSTRSNFDLAGLKWTSLVLTVSDAELLKEEYDLADD